MLTAREFDSLTSRSLNLRFSRLCYGVPSRSVVESAKFILSERTELKDFPRNNKHCKRARAVTSAVLSAQVPDAATPNPLRTADSTAQVIGPPPPIQPLRRRLRRAAAPPDENRPHDRSCARADRRRHRETLFCAQCRRSN